MSNELCFAFFRRYLSHFRVVKNKTHHILPIQGEENTEVGLFSRRCICNGDEIPVPCLFFHLYSNLSIYLNVLSKRCHYRFLMNGASREMTSKSTLAMTMPLRLTAALEKTKLVLLLV